MIKSLPRYVTAYPDRHGRIRYRFRKKGSPDLHLPEPSAKEFRAAYDAALAGADIGIKGRAGPMKPVLGVSYVYFAGAQRGPVKIGVSRNLPSRLSRLRVSSARPVDILALMEGGEKDERTYHQRFAQARQAGEWFTRTLELAAEIRRLRLDWWLTQTRENV